MTLRGLESLVAKDQSADAGMFRVFIGDRGGGAVAEQVHVHIVTEPGSHVLLERSDR